MVDGQMQQQVQQQMQQQVMQQMSMGIAPQIAQQVFHVAVRNGTKPIQQMSMMPMMPVMANMQYGPSRGNGRNKGSDIPLQMIHPYATGSAAM